MTKNQIDRLKEKLTEVDAYHLFPTVLQLEARRIARQEIKERGIEWNEHTLDLAVGHTFSHISQAMHDSILAQLWTMRWIHEATIKEKK